MDEILFAKAKLRLGLKFSAVIRDVTRSSRPGGWPLVRSSANLVNCKLNFDYFRLRQSLGVERLGQY